jgi:hypothetical protein
MMILRHLLFRSSLLLLLVSALPVHADHPTGREEYPVPHHGNLVMYVPDDWNATYYQPEDEAFPVIAFYPLYGPQIFQLTVAVFWEDSPLQDLTAPQNLRRFVESVGQEVLPRSDQDELVLDEIVGNSGVGYLFDLTNSEAGEDEYTYLTQGALGVGNMVVVFSLFRQDQDNNFRELSLRMLKGARQEFEHGEVSFHPDRR